MSILRDREAGPDGFDLYIRIPLRICDFRPANNQAHCRGDVLVIVAGSDDVLAGEVHKDEQNEANSCAPNPKSEPKPFRFSGKGPENRAFVGRFQLKSVCLRRNWWG